MTKVLNVKLPVSLDTLKDLGVSLDQMRDYLGEELSVNDAIHLEETLMGDLTSLDAKLQLMDRLLDIREEYTALKEANVPGTKVEIKFVNEFGLTTE